MSELNIYHHELRPDEYDEFYLKPEADKVIADLEENHKKEVEQLLIDIAELKGSIKNIILVKCLKDKELRHQKYRRCLVMARWCSRMFSITFGKERYWQKWNRRWLELAEKFKPNKEADDGND